MMDILEQVILCCSDRKNSNRIIILVIFHFIYFSLIHSFILFLLFKYSCLYFPAIISPHHSPPPLTLNPNLLCPWVLYTCCLMTLPFFSLLHPSFLPSDYCQCVLHYWRPLVADLFFRILGIDITR